MPAAKNSANAPVRPGLVLTGLGIVFGDLGTSPLYTMQTVVAAAGGHLSAEVALGILSLIVWTLLITVSAKYCVFVMRADNHGEGGILALMSLIGRANSGFFLIGCGLFGAALIYGDGILTPAISVLSALEGVNVATSVLKPYVMPVAVAILVALFASQTLGTAKLGRVFGPVMLLWFIVIAALGVISILHHPGVLVALSPHYALLFLVRHGWGSFLVLGGVFLAITGGEALYADMGHIGRNPIRAGWYCVVLPALLLSYAGQTASLLGHSELHGNPFFTMAPGWAIYPLVGLSTVATIIASQSIITGAFSLTRQAMQLGWFPGLLIRQTSDTEYGQIYVPAVNWAMMVATVAITAAFGSSDRLAGAYGTAVSTTMLLTTVLLYTAMRQLWGWSRALAMPLAGFFLLVDLAFFGANLLKIAEGGWIPLLFGAAIFTIMTTWHKGTHAVRERLSGLSGAPDAFLKRLHENGFPRAPGTAVFLSRTGLPVPPLLQSHARQFGALPELIVGLTARFEETPRVAPEDRVTVNEIGDGLWRVTVCFGFMERPNIPEALAAAQQLGCPANPADALYFCAQDEVARAPDGSALSGWRRMLFSVLYRNAVHAVDRFDMPPDRYIGIVRQIEI